MCTTVYTHIRLLIFWHDESVFKFPLANMCMKERAKYKEAFYMGTTVTVYGYDCDCVCEFQILAFKVILYNSVRKNFTRESYIILL